MRDSFSFEQKNNTLPKHEEAPSIDFMLERLSAWEEGIHTRSKEKNSHTLYEAVREIIDSYGDKENDKFMSDLGDALSEKIETLGVDESVKAMVRAYLEKKMSEFNSIKKLEKFVL